MCGFAKTTGFEALARLRQVNTWADEGWCRSERGRECDDLLLECVSTPRILSTLVSHDLDLPNSLRNLKARRLFTALKIPATSPFRSLLPATASEQKTVCEATLQPEKESEIVHTPQSDSGPAR